MSGSDSRAAAAAAPLDEDQHVRLAVEDVVQAIVSQPAAAFAKAKKEIDILGNIKALKEQQKALRDERKQVSKQLRNEEKRRMRLRKRARQFSDGDLVAVLKMRTDAKADSASGAVEVPSEGAP